MKIDIILNVKGQKLLGGVGVHSIKHVITSLRIQVRKRTASLAFFEIVSYCRMQKNWIIVSPNTDSNDGPRDMKPCCNLSL